MYEPEPGTDPVGDLTDNLCHWECCFCDSDEALCGSTGTGTGASCPMCTAYAGEPCPRCGERLAPLERWVRLWTH